MDLNCNTKLAKTIANYFQLMEFCSDEKAKLAGNMQPILRRNKRLAFLILRWAYHVHNYKPFSCVVKGECMVFYGEYIKSDFVS